MPDNQMMHAITDDERDTILAALRYYQRNCCYGDDGLDTPMPILDIASCEGEHEPLYAPQIDALCERLNTGGEQAKPVYRWEGINPPECVDDWIEPAPAQWDDIVGAMRETRVESINEARKEVESLCVKLARLAAYLNQRCRPSSDGDAGHAAGLKAQNSMAAKVRRALGYSEARDPMWF